jgi:hypothetical protein
LHRSLRAALGRGPALHPPAAADGGRLLNPVADQQQHVLVEAVDDNGVPAVYVAGAVMIWLDFLGSNPDGLANTWIAIYTFPMVLIGTVLLQGEFPYKLGRYYEAHASYFWQVLPFSRLPCFSFSKSCRRSSIPPRE